MLMLQNHGWVTNHGAEPLPSEEENCTGGLLEVTDEEIISCVRSIPKLDTLVSTQLNVSMNVIRHEN